MLHGLVSTGPVITSAGVILAGTFLVLTTLPVWLLFELGFTVAFGVLLDTFLVRSAIVPAVTTMLGDRIWWPSNPRAGTRGLSGVIEVPAAGLGPRRGSPQRLKLRQRRLERLACGLASDLSCARQLLPIEQPDAVNARRNHDVGVLHGRRYRVGRAERDRPQDRFR